MKTAWDYTELAKAYVNRPDYDSTAIDKMLEIAEVKKGGSVCDVGAGTAHLTIPLLQRGICVVAVEPNDAMREIGKKRTEQWPQVSWYEGTGEKTCQPSNSFDLVTFGSSFNVTDRLLALRETHRILKKKGWLACMWNHRFLEDPLQKAIETIIYSYIPDYSYGARREDQTKIIVDSGLFYTPKIIEGRVMHQVPRTTWVDAWASHATLQRQAGKNFTKIVDDIKDYVSANVKENVICVPYITKIWIAQKYEVS